MALLGRYNLIGLSKLKLGEFLSKQQPASHFPKLGCKGFRDLSLLFFFMLRAVWLTEGRG